MNENETQSEVPQVAPAEVKPARAKKAKPEVKLGEVIRVAAKDVGKYLLPEDESDPYWDAKMKLDVPQSVVDSLATDGWDASMAAIAKRDADGKLHLAHGRTRWRALEKANRERAKEKLPPVEPYVLIEDEDDTPEGTLTSIMRGMRLNLNIQKVDPMTLAEDIVRLLSAGADEKAVAKVAGISVSDLHGYLLLTDESKCPPAVQELLREGHISFTAALELARKAENMSASDMKQAAEQIAKVSAGGVKITSAQVKKAANVKDNDQPATQKEKKVLMLSLQSADLKGKGGEAAKWAAIVAMEVGLGTRTIDSFWTALDSIAKGKTPRIDFKQYQTDGKEKPVKGQDK